MPPIHMSRRERAELKRLARNPIPIADIPPDNAAKFIKHRLAVDQSLQLRITPKGQLELLRQRYRGLATRKVVVPASAHDFIARIEQRVAEGRRRPKGENRPPAVSRGTPGLQERKRSAAER
ncbi:MAG: hypothetical protein Kow0032_17980 [Methyloligellaceae bacterium]